MLAVCCLVGIFFLGYCQVRTVGVLDRIMVLKTQLRLRNKDEPEGGELKRFRRGKRGGCSPEISFVLGNEGSEKRPQYVVGYRAEHKTGNSICRRVKI